MTIKRRDFNKAVLAAVAGIVAGSVTACSGDKKSPETTTKENPKTDSGMGNKASEMGLEKHVCKGYNTCKGKGGCKTDSNACAGKNECKGKGGCATTANHSCGGKNDCKGLGGCKSGDNSCVAKNSCKGKGGCHVPVIH